VKSVVVSYNRLAEYLEPWLGIPAFVPRPFKPGTTAEKQCSLSGSTLSRDFNQDFWKISGTNRMLDGKFDQYCHRLNSPKYLS